MVADSKREDEYVFYLNGEYVGGYDELMATLTGLDNFTNNPDDGGCRACEG